MSKPVGKIHPYCLNCYRPLPPFAKHCPHCGQKNTDGKITLREWLNELMETVLNVDSRFFRTLGALFIPGKLTEAYFEGKHERYAKPLRLFFITAVIHFAVLSNVIGSFFESITELVDENRKQIHQLDFVAKLNLEKDTILAKYPGDKDIPKALDSLIIKMKPASDSMTLTYFVFQGLGPTGPNNTVTFALKDIFGKKKAEEIIKEAGIKDPWIQLQLVQSIKLYKSGDGFPAFILGKLIWMVLLMMPALAFILKLLYIRRKRYFVEHLVFSYHYHAFSFLAMSVALLMSGAGLGNSNEEEFGFIELWALIFILGYLFVAMRRVYKQGFIRTFIKFILLNFSYLFLFTTALLLTLLAGFLLF